MPFYEVRGVLVDFPHQAYEAQLLYMDQVIGALQEVCVCVCVHVYMDGLV